MIKHIQNLYGAVSIALTLIGEEWIILRMWLKSFLNAIPAAAQSPYALVAYAIAAILMAFGGFNLLKLIAVLREIKKVRPKPVEFKQIIELTTNTKLPARISGEQWIRNNRLNICRDIVFAFLVVVLVIAVVALCAKPSAEAQTQNIDTLLKQSEKEGRIHAFSGRFETQQGFGQAYMIGQSGTAFFLGHPGSLLNATNPASFHITEENSIFVDRTAEGNLRVSAKVRGRDGLLAEIENNEWKVAQQPKSWDRNYSTNALEVKDADDEIVFQIILEKGLAHVQGVFFDLEGNGFGLTEAPQRGAIITYLQSGRKVTMPHIKPLFKYPSDLHLGELVGQ